MADAEFVQEVEDVLLFKKTTIRDASDLDAVEDTLFNLGAKVIEPLLIIYERNDGTSVRLSVPRILMRFGEEAAGLLIEAVENKTLNARSVYASVLGEIGSKQAVPTLLRCLDETNEGYNESLKGAAAHALGKIGDERGLFALVRLSQEETDYFTFLSVLNGLGCFKHPLAINTLISLYNSMPDEKLRSYILRQLREIGGAEVTLFLQNILANSVDERLGFEAACNLVFLADNTGLAIVLANSSNSDESVRAKANEALNYLRWLKYQQVRTVVFAPELQQLD